MASLKHPSPTQHRDFRSRPRVDPRGGGAGCILASLSRPSLQKTADGLTARVPAVLGWGSTALQVLLAKDLSTPDPAQHFRGGGLYTVTDCGVCLTAQHLRVAAMDGPERLSREENPLLACEGSSEDPRRFLGPPLPPNFRQAGGSKTRVHVRKNKPRECSATLPNERHTGSAEITPLPPRTFRAVRQHHFPQQRRWRQRPDFPIAKPSSLTDTSRQTEPPRHDTLRNRRSIR